jgi:hypothetical protein
MDNQVGVIHLPKIGFEAHQAEEMSAPACDTGFDGNVNADPAFDILIDGGTKEPVKKILKYFDCIACMSYAGV